MKIHSYQVILFGKDVKLQKETHKDLAVVVTENLVLSADKNQIVLKQKITIELPPSSSRIGLRSKYVLVTIIPIITIIIGVQ